jgi:hypothetical protein
MNCEHVSHDFNLPYENGKQTVLALHNVETQKKGKEQWYPIKHQQLT